MKKCEGKLQFRKLSSENPFNKKISVVRLHEKTLFKISLSNPPKNGNLKRFRALYEVFEIQKFFILYRGQRQEV